LSHPAPSENRGRSSSTARIVDSVFRPGAVLPFRRGVVGVAVAVALHFGLWLMARQSEPSLESWSADLAARVHGELGRRSDLELVPPPPPEPVQPALEEREPLAEAREPQPPATPLRERRTSRGTPAPPAQAGQVIAQDPSADSAVDLTAQTFVTGMANAYAGGTTTARGTNAVAVSTRAVDPNAAPTAHTGDPDRSSTVRLEGGEWRCAWPREADAEQIDEQAVVIRVVVRADGSVESASVVSDPGHGFGQAAMACATRTRFVPARDRSGRPVRTTSPPIRVRFTR